MAIRIKGSITKALESYVVKAKRAFAEPSAWKIIVKEIKDQIQRGISPVAGIGRFQKYSTSYRDAIKSGKGDASKKSGKVSPVNMTLSGEMLDSLNAKRSGTKLKIGFKDKKAAFHNDQGAGKSKVIRRLLPTDDGEKFNAKLLQNIREVVKRIFIKIR